jgi:hypothetical protein
VKPNLNGPPDLGAGRFHERWAAAVKVEAIQTPLPEIAVPKRHRKLAPVAAWENGVTAKAENAPGRARSSGLTQATAEHQARPSHKS